MSKVTDRIKPVMSVPTIVRSLAGHPMRGKSASMSLVGQDREFGWRGDTACPAPSRSDASGNHLSDQAISDCSGTSITTDTSRSFFPGAQGETGADGDVGLDDGSDASSQTRHQKRLTFRRVVRAVALLGESRGSTLTDIREVLTRDLGITTLHSSLEGLQRQLERGVDAGILTQNGQGDDCCPGAGHLRFKLTTLPARWRAVYRYRVKNLSRKRSRVI